MTGEKHSYGFFSTHGVHRLRGSAMFGKSDHLQPVGGGTCLALVDDMPGLTRHRNTGPRLRLGAHDIILTDTAGLEDAEPGSIVAPDNRRRPSPRPISSLFAIDARSETDVRR